MSVAIAKYVDAMMMTEKVNQLAEKNKVMTVLATSCEVTKLQIKSAFESAFPDVKVAKVRSIVLHPKTKIFRGRKGVCVKRKKMMITFKSDAMFDVVSEGLKICR